MAKEKKSWLKSLFAYAENQKKKLVWSVISVSAGL